VLFSAVTHFIHKRANMQLQTRAFVASAKAPLSRRVALCRVSEGLLLVCCDLRAQALTNAYYGLWWLLQVTESDAAPKVATVEKPAAAGTPANVAELPKPE
jgi:hypothetical protein